ncbi:MAG: nickel transporter permease [Paenibacillaceae bacterium]|jgi:ABC-type dipeptide/oligopeptide/nickel transport system permease component|nr:nickel transporter permease [Paenibacillaceae bacterium]
MYAFARKRLVSFLLVLAGVTLLSFCLSAISAVDPAEAFARRSFLQPTPEKIAEIRREMGLDQPLYRQYYDWIKSSVQGDLGTSLLTRNPVAADIARKLPVTLELVAAAMLWIVLITVPVSVTAAVKKDSLFDRVVSVLTIAGISLPNFWLGFLLLLVFAVIFPVFPVVSGGGLPGLILPSLTLALPIASASIRLFRATILSNLNKDYVMYAKARGLSDTRIIWGHVLKNSLPPMVTMFSQYMGYMIAGSAIAESIFSRKGLGLHLISAIVGRDLPTINGCVLVIALIFVACGLAADLINLLLNPRMMEGEDGSYA